MAYTKYSLTPADNNAAPPNGAPEGMLPSAVNDTMRDMMAQIRDVGDGIRGGTYTMTAPVITGGSITGSTINNSAIGGTTAAAGKFTTLEATGVTTVQAGTASAPAITTTGDTNTGIFFPAADTIAFTEGGVESMRIDSSGNVGIGTDSPSVASGIGLVVYNNGPSRLVLKNNDTGNASGDGFQIAINGTEAYIEQRENAPTIFTTNNTERMRIDSSGNVGIGTSSPNLFAAETESRLIVGTGSGNTGAMTLYSGTTGTGTINWADGTSGNATYAGILRYDHNQNSMQFFTNGLNERMRISSAGDLLVGCTSNTTNGGFIFSTNFYGAGRSTQVIGHINGASSGDAYMVFNYNGTGIGSITQSGTTAVLYNVTSDQRLKTNVVDAPSGNIDDIKVRSFDWIADGSHQEYGMVAQELVTVAPYAVHQPQDPDEMMAVDYSKLVPMMIKEIQDLKQRIKTLENK